MTTSKLNGLAIALGTGTWLAAAPWLAAADLADTSGLDVTTALDPSALFESSAADTSGLDYAVSYNGQTLFAMGDAQATTTAGGHDLAIAYGAGSTATADGSSNVALAENGGTAFSGEPLESLDGNSSASGAYELALADGAGSSATTGFGDGNIAEVFGTDSSAVAGLGTAFENGGGANDSDLAAVFGNDYTATATGFSNLYDIEPGGYTNIAAEVAAALAPSDDLGLSNLLADLSSLGL